MNEPDDLVVSAHHEAGHAVIGALIGVNISFVTITEPAHCTLSWRGVLKISLSDSHRAVFFLAGMTVQRYYFPTVPIISRNDEAVLIGLPEHRRITYTDFINHHLADPAMRRKIEDLAARLVAEFSITF
jgi:hypothetical protein